MGFYLPLWGNKKLYIRSPFKIVYNRGIRYIEDEQEMLDVFGSTSSPIPPHVYTKIIDSAHAPSTRITRKDKNK